MTTRQSQAAPPESRQEAPHDRLPYEPPRILDEEVFEREALLATCRTLAVCSPVTKTPS